MKIPAQAKRVFKGIVFDVYQWPQKMFDGSFSTFEMIKRANTVEVMAISGDRILLTHQSQPNKDDFYSLIGGRGEEGEEPLVTAKRELLEEAGLTSDSFELYKIYEPVHKVDWQVYLYIARDCRRVANQKLDAGEKIEIKECTFEEFVELIVSNKYWGNELTLEVLRMKDQGSLNEFKKKLLE